MRQRAPSGFNLFNCTSKSAGLAAGASLFLAVGLPAEEFIEINPVADTCIAESFPDKNFGAMEFFTAGTTQNYTTNRGLLKFDLAGAIPAGSKILGVALTVEVTQDPDEPWNSSNFGLHRMLRDWGEGNNYAPIKLGQAGPAGTNEACWTHRFAFTPATWGQPGGQAGVDYVSSRSSFTFVYQAGEPYTFESSPELLADTQLWLDQPSTNFGWMIIELAETSPFTARRIGSRESPINAPRLSITYQPPPPITGISAINGLVLLEFFSAANIAHQVQFSTNLISGSWLSYPPIGPFTNATTVYFGTPMQADQGFYRLKVY